MAKLDAQDRKVFENLASAKVEDFCAEPSPMIPGAISSATLRTPESRFRNKRTEDEVAIFNGGKIDGQAGCQYTADCGSAAYRGVVKRNR